MANQAIIQAAMSLVKTFDGNKNILSVDNISWKWSINFQLRHLASSILKNDSITSNLSPEIEERNT